MLSEKRKVMNITTKTYLRIMKILNKRLSENRFFEKLFLSCDLRPILHRFHNSLTDKLLYVLQFITWPKLGLLCRLYVRIATPLR